METKTSPLADKKARMRFNKAMREKGVAAKACSKCFVVKGHIGFAVARQETDGRAAYCRACSNVATRRWRKENPEKQAAASRRWYVENRSRHAHVVRQWKGANPDTVRASSRISRSIRRARKASTTVTPFTHEDMLRDWEDHDLYGCAFCGGPYEEIEHLVPLSRGGEHSLANIVPSCIECNRGVGGKHARDPWEWLAERFPNLAPLLLDADPEA
ncbi:HNH endonuclease [Streptomyces sp. NPDC057509]|uniref:HNH endonuclease n=1 Tax=Streptomyces sp. NPDC057509 TaxID=3346152 RepID=UPI00369DC9A5